MHVLHSAPAPKGSRRVFFAIPAYGPIPALTAFALFQSERALSEAGIDAELCILSGHCHVDDARNLLVGRFLSSACDSMVFIDADVGWQPPDLVRLVKHDREVVAGVYRLKQDAEDYPANLPPGEIWADADGLIEAVSVPTGFLKIQRSVLELLATRSRHYRPDGRSGTEVAEIFYRDIDENGSRVSGDVNFCHRWRKAGGKIHVDPELWLEHAGDRVWQGSYGSYLRRLNGLDLLPWLEKIRAGTFEPQELVPLVCEYGNDGFVAQHELLKGCIEIARQAKGPVLDIGSGLSSIVMAAAGAEVHALEHDPIWLSELLRQKRRAPHLLSGLHVHHAPLVDYAEGRWYDAAPIPWKDVDLVVVDGPPRSVSNRSIAFRVMQEKGCRPRLMLVDDHCSVDLPEAEYRFEIHGNRRQFAVGRRKLEAIAA